MATVANVKNVDMTQLEFQNLGSSRVQAVLQQPLLQNSSTYTCELTSVQLSLDGEALLPVGEEFFTVGFRPINGQIADLKLLKERLDGPVEDVKEGWYGDLVPHMVTNALKNFLTTGGDPDFDPNTGFWRYRTILFEGLYLDENVIDSNGWEQYVLHAMPGSNSVRFKRYQTRVGLADDLISQIDRLGRLLFVRARMFAIGLGGALNWAEVRDEDRLIRAYLDEEGRLVVVFDPEFFKFYWVRCGPGWKKLMGTINDFEFILGTQDNVGSKLITSMNGMLGSGIGYHQDTGVGDFEQSYNPNGRFDFTLPANVVMNFSYDNADVRNPDSVLGNIFPWTFNGVNVGQIVWDPNRFRYVPPYVGNNARRIFGTKPLSDYDNLKKVIVEASFPVSHTLCWGDTEERQVMQFQEFRLVPRLDMNINPNGSTEFVERTEIGPRRFLDNSGGLALKKLFEGQIQALRIDVLREDEEGEKAREKRIVDMQASSFMYLKFLFTKETV